MPGAKAEMPNSEPSNLTKAVLWVLFAYFIDKSMSTKAVFCTSQLHVQFLNCLAQNFWAQCKQSYSSLSSGIIKLNKFTNISGKTVDMQLFIEMWHWMLFLISPWCSHSHLPFSETLRRRSPGHLCACSESLVFIALGSLGSLSAVNPRLCKLSKESCKCSYFVVIKVIRTLCLTCKISTP